MTLARVPWPTPRATPTRADGPTSARIAPAQPELIVRGFHQILLSSKITLGGLHGGMTEQQLDLFQVAARGPAEFRASATGIVGLQLDSEFLPVLRNQRQNGLRRERAARNGAVPVHRP